jgi:tetratricopeptide (TPR) repeat protein
MSAAGDHVPINSGYHTKNAKLLVFAGAAVLLIAVTLTFFPAIHNGFVDFDDPLYILENPRVQSGFDWQGVKWAFTTGYGANWHPITWLSHLIDYELFKLRPWGHHFTSVILHAANTILLFIFLRTATGAFGRSFAVAALFGVHPLHVESVAWIAERKDVLSTTFWMLGMLSYGRWVAQVKSTGRRSRLNYGLTSVIFALGLMSKPMVVAFPLALLLLDYWPFERLDTGDTGARRFLRLVFEKWPLFLLSIASAGVTYLVQRQGGAMEAKNYFPWVVRLTNIPISYCRYLGKIFCPINLSPYYIHPRIWPVAEVFFATLFLAVLSVVVIQLRRRMPYLFLGWGWFIITLLPVIGIIQVGTQSIADRYTYVPSIGIFIAICWSLPKLLPESRVAHLIISSATMAVLIILAHLTRVQIAYWRDTVALFRHALVVEPDNNLAHLDLGVGLAEQGRTAEAMREVREALRLNGDIAEAYLTLGSLLSDEGRFGEAIISFREGLARHPNDAKGHLFLGIALHRLGSLDAAAEEFRAAARLQPELVEAFNNLGMVYREQGKFDAAIEAYRQALATKPAFADAHNNLAIALYSSGRSGEALSELREALRLNPQSPEFHTNFGICLEGSSKIDEALAEYREALRLNPNYSSAQIRLNQLLARNAKGHPK